MGSMKRKPKSDKKRLTVYLPTKLYKRFYQQAKAQGISLSWYMEFIMSSHVPRIGGIKHDEPLP